MESYFLEFSPFLRLLEVGIRESRKRNDNYIITTVIYSDIVSRTHEQENSYAVKEHDEDDVEEGSSGIFLFPFVRLANRRTDVDPQNRKRKPGACVHRQDRRYRQTDDPVNRQRG